LNLVNLVNDKVLRATIPRMPAEFTRADVERIARLARLELTEHEKMLLTPQLSSFLAYAEQVQQVSTAGVPPTSHPLGTVGSWRDDVPQPPLDRTEALSQGAEADLERGLFKVPRVLA
jgi:aspartyl-tRNA(Asn)/glutamyl-tRNA(Gln) amidotransferase subunit C